MGDGMRNTFTAVGDLRIGYLGAGTLWMMGDDLSAFVLDFCI